MKFHKGQMLVEMLLAIAITGMVLVAVSQITTRALSNTSLSRSRTDANKYVTEAQEWIRSQRDVAWNNVYSKVNATPYCFTTSPISAWPAAAGNCAANQVVGSGFYRNVTITNRNVGQVQQVEVKVAVTWKEGSLAADHVVQQIVNLSSY